MTLTSDAPTIWNLLKGIVCVYKPAGITVASLRKIFIGNISRGKMLLNLFGSFQKMIRWGTSNEEPKREKGEQYD